MMRSFQRSFRHSQPTAAHDTGRLPTTPFKPTARRTRQHRPLASPAQAFSIPANTPSDTQQNDTRHGWPVHPWRTNHDSNTPQQSTYQPPSNFLASPATYTHGTSSTGPVPTTHSPPAQLPPITPAPEHTPSWLDAVLARPAARLSAESGEAAAASLARLAETRAVPTREEMRELLGAVQLQMGALGLGELARVAAALVKLGHRPDEEFMAVFDRELLRHVPNCPSPAALVSTLHSLARLGTQPSARLLHSTIHEALRQSSRLSLHSLSELVWSLARLGRQPGPAWLGAFAEATGQRLEQEGSQQLRRQLLSDEQDGVMSPVPAAAQGSAKRPRHLYVAVPLENAGVSATCAEEGGARSAVSAEEEVVHMSSSLFPSTLTNMLWAHAKLRAEPSSHWLASYHTALSASVPSFAPGQLSLSLSALASWCASGRLGHGEAAALLALLLGEVQQKLALMRPGDLATTLWALARLDHRPDPHCMAALLDAAQGQLPRMAASQLAALAWALAKLEGKTAAGGDGQPGQLSTDKTGDALDGRATSEQREQLVIAVAAAAQQGAAEGSLAAAASEEDAESAGAFWEAFLLEVRAKLPAFSSGGLANVVWALGRLRRDPGVQFAKELWPELQRRSSSFSPHELSTLLWALARLQLAPPAPWLTEQLTTIQPHLGHLSSQELTHTTWALAQLHDHGGPTPPPGFLPSVERVTAQLLFSFSLQELVTLLSGFSRLGYEASKGWLACCVGELRARVSLGGDQLGEGEVGDLLREAGLESVLSGTACR